MAIFLFTNYQPCVTMKDTEKWKEAHASHRLEMSVSLQQWELKKMFLKK